VSTQHVADPGNWLDFVRTQAEQVWGNLDAVPDEIAADWYDGMSTNELRQCAAEPLVTIGSHGVTHASLLDCDDDLLARELQESKAFLEEVTGRKVEYFAYPYGYYDERVARQTQRAGYRAAFVIDPVGVGLADFELPRIGIYQADRKYLSLKFSGLHRRPLSVESEQSSAGAIARND
jgi:peptidoglycan/xylan/chitin deacetylase (PgdA/CDA1 family)